jgi:NAD(P)H-flavin reductase/hemoglobin-like flavoprotein
VATAGGTGISASDGVADALASIPVQFAPGDGGSRAGGGTQPATSAGTGFDRRLVRDSFAHVMSDPQQVMNYLYGRLFAANPEMRGLFPLTMTQTRAVAFRMLARLFWNLEDVKATERTLAHVATVHRKYGVREKHYQPFFDAMLATAEHVIGSAWTPEMGTAWRAALAYFADVMQAAADADAQEQPAWWTSEVVQHDRRADSIAVLSLRPDRPLSYLPGQHIAVQVPRWPRVWRHFSVANAPRDNGLIDIHVRAVPGGLVSTALVAHCSAGDTLLLGAAHGDLRVVDDPGRDLVCVAGGTGLAPVKALTEAVVGAAGHGRRRAVTIYFGVRRSGDLYDMRDLQALALAYPSLTLIPVVQDDIDFSGRVGKLSEVVATHPSFRDCDVYISGPAGMITATVRALSSRVPAERLHHDPLDLLRQARRPPAIERSGPRPKQA